MRDALTPTADPAWTIRQDGFDSLRDRSRQSRFAVGNGFLGVPGGRTFNRGVRDVDPPCTWVAGLFDLLRTEEPMPALVPAPDWMRLHVSLDAASCGLRPNEESSHRRTLDMRRGLLLTESLLANVPGVVIRLMVLRLVSQSDRAVGLQLSRAVVEEGDIDVTLEASFEGVECGLVAEALDQDAGLWRTNATSKRLAIKTAMSLRVDGKPLAPTTPKPLTWLWRWRVHPGQEICLERTVAIVRDDTLDGDVATAARETLGRARDLGWRGMLTRHETAWAERWRSSDVVIEGDAAAQRALRFATYHLNSAANPADERVSIAARGLTGPDYHGHVFWDTEIFLLPFYTLTWPAAARALLMYRFHTLDGARGKAARLGWRGALYAWESADTGAEATPEHAIGPDRKVVTILCGTQEQHISADVAYAVWQYWDVTGDEAFLLDAGAEILLETARFWASRAAMEADGHRHIRGVIGPDEYHEHIDDNAFTNVMARWNILRALDAAALLRARWPERWTTLASRIGVDDAELKSWAGVAVTIATGLDPKTGLYEQFAGFSALEHIDLADYAGRSVPMDVVLGPGRIAASQVVKQADVVALLALLPGEFAGDAGALNFDHYAPLCSHGSSLSRAMHGVAAARLGRSRLALSFMMAASTIDLSDDHAAIDGGVHVASLGGIWMIAVLGFAGVSFHPDCVEVEPCLPTGWSSLAFAVQWRGRTVRLAIDAASRMVRATLEAGEPMTLVVAGQRGILSRAGPLHLAFGTPAPAALAAA